LGIDNFNKIGMCQYSITNYVFLILRLSLVPPPLQKIRTLELLALR
jgi:hypothetical protein